MRIFRRGWFQIFVAGIVLLFLIERTLVATANPIYLPSVILFGAFLVPITFTTYLYESLPDWEVPLPPLAICFFWGGVIGTVVAGTVEYDVLKSLGPFAFLGVGVIEEIAKLILPVIIYFMGKYRSEAAGIILGVCSAMGFAALETMGYGFVVLLESRGNLAALDEVLLIRGLTSPAGHAAWTGIVCAVLFRERLKKGRPTLNRRVVGAFFVAVVLHAAWDTFASGNAANGVGFLALKAGSLGVALLSLFLLIRKVREARRSSYVSRVA